MSSSELRLLLGDTVVVLSSNVETLVLAGRTTGAAHVPVGRAAMVTSVRRQLLSVAAAL